MTSAPLSLRLLRAYRTAKKTATKALKTYLVAVKDVDKKYQRLQSFPKVVIRSKADLETVIKVKWSNPNWEVKVKVPTKYKPNGRDKPSEQRLMAIASKVGIEFVSRKVRRG